eukprot:scaffold388509_cov15-Prasinocladus_malaysianus.AAC.1
MRLPTQAVAIPCAKVVAGVSQGCRFRTGAPYAAVAIDRSFLSVLEREGTPCSVGGQMGGSISASTYN